jgi:transposase InsO family protein
MGQADTTPITLLKFITDSLSYAPFVALGASILWCKEVQQEEVAAQRGRRPVSLARVSWFDTLAAQIPGISVKGRYLVNFVIFVLSGTVVGCVVPYPMTNFRQALLAGFAWTTVFLKRS